MTILSIEALLVVRDSAFGCFLFLLEDVPVFAVDKNIARPIAWPWAAILGVVLDDKDLSDEDATDVDEEYGAWGIIICCVLGEGEWINRTDVEGFVVLASAGDLVVSADFASWGESNFAISTSLWFMR